MSPTGLRFSTLSRNLVEDRVMLLGSNPNRVSMMFSTSRRSLVEVRGAGLGLLFGLGRTGVVSLVAVVFSLSAETTETNDFASARLWTLATTVSRTQAVSAPTPDIDAMRRRLFWLSRFQPRLVTSRRTGWIIDDLSFS